MWKILPEMQGKNFKSLDELALLPPYQVILLIALGELVFIRQKPVCTPLDYNLVKKSLTSGV